MKKILPLIFISIFLIIGSVLEFIGFTLPYTGFVLFAFYLSLSILLWTNTRSFFPITLFTLLLEAVGLYTSFPFGHYVYGNLVAVPSLMNVPLFIPLAWYVLICAATQLFPKWYLAGLFIIFLDIILEHFATATGLWSWPGHLGPLTAPIQNYLAWGIVASIGYFIVPKNSSLRFLSKSILMLLISYMVLVSLILM